MVYTTYMSLEDRYKAAVAALENIVEYGHYIHWPEYDSKKIASDMVKEAKDVLLIIEP